MSDFSTEIRLRVDAARRSLADARAEGDDYLVEVRLGELESLARIAADHHLTIDGLTLPDAVPPPGPAAAPTPAGGLDLTLAPAPATG